MEENITEKSDPRVLIHDYMKARRIPQSLIYRSDNIIVSQSHIRQILTVRDRPLTEALRNQINELLGTNF